MTKENFRKEIAAAVKAFDKHVVCLEKSSGDFEAALTSLMQKAITAYENRGPNLRHGIALDKHVTVILSQSDSPREMVGAVPPPANGPHISRGEPRPLCGIYFNLHSPYQKNTLPKTVKAVGATDEAAAETESP